MMGAVQLGESDDYLARGGKRVAALAKSMGVYLRPLGNVVYIAPALNIGADELERLLAVVGDCVQVVVTNR
jgi:adenosylmethionine-8-amino-7-oxononanoate aminotransferase